MYTIFMFKKRYKPSPSLSWGSQCLWKNPLSGEVQVADPNIRQRWPRAAVNPGHIPPSGCHHSWCLPSWCPPLWRFGVLCVTAPAGPGVPSARRPDLGVLSVTAPATAFLALTIPAPGSGHLGTLTLPGVLASSVSQRLSFPKFTAVTVPGARHPDICVHPRSLSLFISIYPCFTAALK